MTAKSGSLLSVEAALDRILASARPTEAETVAIADADGRVLAAPLAAPRDQPPFDASAMDGYAVRSADIAQIPAVLTVAGAAQAGGGYRGTVGPGQAVRIFTGAPVPAGADAIVIQENTRRDGERVHVIDGQPERTHIRTRGFDFTAGQQLLAPGTRLGPRTLTLAAAMGHGTVAVHRMPTVCVLATGDELVLPGDPVGDDQIVCSNPFGIMAMARRAGARATFLGIAPDDRAALAAAIERASGADVLVTIGGASVGDHDLVGPVLRDLGVTLDFWKIAMRPGKPLMYGRRGAGHVLGLPGNPVSSLICARVFLVPLIHALTGQPLRDTAAGTALLSEPLPANGPRRHYMRGRITIGADGAATVAPIPSQDSSLLAALATSDTLIVREPDDPALPAGAPVTVLPVDF